MLYILSNKCNSIEFPISKLYLTMQMFCSIEDLNFHRISLKLTATTRFI